MGKEKRHIPMKIRHDMYTKNRDGPKDDDMCIMCLDSCVKKSTCSNRYFKIQGFYQNDEVEDVLGICDRCFVAFDILQHRYDLYFNFEDVGEFHVSSYWREEN